MRWRFAFGILCIAGAAAVTTAATAGQQSTAPKMPPLINPSLAGRDIFSFYCSPCHGRDGTGGGPVAAALKTTPPDLTKLTLRNGGTFPRRQVEQFVTNGGDGATAHGSSEMPVWGPTFRALEPSDKLVKIRIENVIDYVQSIQIPPSVPRQQPATSGTGKLMREKLGHAQKILEALASSDYTLLEREAVALERITESPKWDVLRTPEFGRYSAAFVKAAHDLAESARQRDLDLAASQYGGLTMSCYQCHRYLKGARIARN